MLGRYTTGPQRRWRSIPGQAATASSVRRPVAVHTAIMAYRTATTAPGPRPRRGERGLGLGGMATIMNSALAPAVKATNRPPMTAAA